MDLENELGGFEELVLDEEYLDDIDKISNSNEMVESLVEALSNLSIDLNTHEELLNLGFLNIIEKLI